MGSLLYATESAFGETTTTTGTRLRSVALISTDGFEVPSEPVTILKQYPHEAVNYTRMPHTAKFTIELMLTGLGSTSAGAVSANDLATFLAAVFGQGGAGLATGTTTTGGTASVPTTTAASGAAAGALVHIGAKLDTRADGQWAAVSSHSGSNLTLLTALPVAPANADVLYGSRMVYPSESAGTYETQTSFRFLILTAQQRYLAHGCWPTSAEWMIEVGTVPKLRLSFESAWWELVTTTFPSATSVQDYGGAPISGGSFFINAVGTATRATETVRSLSMKMALNVVGERGVNGTHAFQVITGCHRAPSTTELEIVVDSEAAGTDTWGTTRYNIDENTRVAYHALYSMSTADGRALALYWPSLRQNRMPVQFDDGGALRKRVSFMCCTGATTTNDLTLSHWRLGMA